MITINHQKLRMVGLGDLWSKQMRPEDVLFKRRLTEKIPVIVLSHNPDGNRSLAHYQWDLVLCGHTHGGQLRIPLIGAPFAPVKDDRYVEGLHNLNGRWIHVTRGVGNVHGIRINCRPQISLIEFV